MTFRTALFYPWVITCLLSVLSACSPPTSDPTDAPHPQSVTEQIQQLLADAQHSTDPQRQKLQLQAVRLLLKENQRDLAARLLEQLSNKQLTTPLYFDFVELQCRLFIQRGQYSDALATLESPRLLAEDSQLHLKRQLTFNDLRSRVLGLLGNHLASVQQRIYNDPLLSPAKQTANREAIWHSLMLMPANELRHYLNTAFSHEYQGWLKLALIAKGDFSDIDEQVRQLDEWQRHWQQHPANVKLPYDLALIRELAANQPKHISLILPLSGKLAAFGQAVRDGFMSAYYQAKQGGAKVPKLSVYDSDQHDDFIALYKQVSASGTELIIGPLEKSRVQSLLNEEIYIPTLALNRAEGAYHSPKQLFQFGLAPRDEAIQIAEIAYLEKHQHTMIIAPQTLRGKRIGQVFAERWTQLIDKPSQHIITESLFTGQKDYSSTIENALLLQHSKKRAQRIRKLVGEPIVSMPRRRQDIDMIFLLARPQQARSIKPLLDYHYAGQLPIYATSRVYTGYEDRQKDRDINGVKFTDMPWVLNPPSALKMTIDREIETSKQYLHMYALGIDSYQLYPRLKQLQQRPNSRVYGQTGTLKLNRKNHIERRMLFAQIVNGRAKQIAIADQGARAPNNEASNSGETKDGEQISGTAEGKFAQYRATNRGPRSTVFTESGTDTVKKELPLQTR